MSSKNLKWLFETEEKGASNQKSYNSNFHPEALGLMMSLGLGGRLRPEKSRGRQDIPRFV